MTTLDRDELRRLLIHWVYKIIAFLIDAVFLYIIFILSIALAAYINATLDLDSGEYHGNFGEALGASLSRIFMIAIGIMMFVLLIWGGLEGKWGRTPGKVVMRLKVVSANDHNRTIGIWRGIARIIVASSVIPVWLLFSLLSLPFAAIRDQLSEAFLWTCLVFWLSDHLSWPIWDKQHQTFHDKITGSHVISTRPN